METRALGNTGLSISRLVIGAGAVGGLFVRGSEQDQARALAIAEQAGINWIDTAPLYGNGASETALGHALGATAYSPSLSTKVMLDTDDLSDISGQVRRSIEQSLKRLGRDNVALLQLHNPITASPTAHQLSADAVLRKGGALDALREARDSGLCDAIGLTALGDAPAIIEAIDSGGFDTAQVYYNLLNPSAAIAIPESYPGGRFDGVLAACARHNMGTLAIRIFSAGVIATDARHGREAPLTAGDTVASETEKAHEMLAALGDGHGSRAQLALRFVLAQNALDAAIVGFEHLAYLDEALAAYDMGPLSADVLARIAQVWQGKAA